MQHSQSGGQPEQIDESLLKNRCGFCAAELPPGTEICPQCGHRTSEGFLVRPRRPLWVRVLAALVLLLIVLGLAGWAVQVVLRLFFGAE